jgi:methyl-accepting chemotaxis protein
VQRLAERSGEATKQIGAIVRTIQTDTQDTVSAMEESTRGVVEGARLSDAAGKALAEIGEVSQALTALIENISACHAGGSRLGDQSGAQDAGNIAGYRDKRPPARRKQPRQLVNWPVWRPS